MDFAQENLWNNLPIKFSSSGLIEAAHVLGIFLKSSDLKSQEESFDKIASDTQRLTISLSFKGEKDIENMNEKKLLTYLESQHFLEESQKRNIDLQFVLLRNSFLQSRGFFYLVRSILSPLEDARKDLYLDSIISVLNQNLQLWSDLYKDFSDLKVGGDLEINVQDLKGKARIVKNH